MDAQSQVLFPGFLPWDEKDPMIGKEAGRQLSDST